MTVRSIASWRMVAECAEWFALGGVGCSDEDGCGRRELTAAEVTAAR